MNKNGLLLTSLLGAIPGAILALLMIISFVSYAGGWSFYVKGLSGLLLLAGGGLVAIPVYLFVQDRPKTAKAPKKAAGEPADTQAVAAAAESGEVASGEVAVAEDDAFAFDSSSGDSGEFVEATAEPAAEAGSDDFDLGDDFNVDEETPKPKKK